MTAAASRARLGALALGVALASAGGWGCGGEAAPAPSTAKRVTAPQWQDAFDGTPEVLVVVRPQAVKRDGVYGSLFKSAVRVALARGAVSGTNAVELLESSEEVIVAVHKDPEAGVDDAAVVFRGVPASFDPTKIVDGSGAPLLRALDERGKVAEYVPTASGARGNREASVFVLPDRTWVLATGGARARGRQAFATPSGRPAPKVDERALALLRVGPELAMQPRFAKSPVLGPLTRHLSSATVLLDPGRAGARVVLAYQDDDSAAYAEMQVKRISDAFTQSDPKRYAWLSESKVARGLNSVTVTLPVPQRLLEELPSAAPTDLGL